MLGLAQYVLTFERITDMQGRGGMLCCSEEECGICKNAKLALLYGAPWVWGWFAPPNGQQEPGPV